MNISKFLKSIFLFSELKEEFLFSLSKFCIVKEFKKGSFVFEDGKKANFIYILIRGKVKIYKVSEEGSEHILHIHIDRSVLAEASIFDSGFFPAYCQTLEDSKLLLIPKDKFISFIKENSDVSMKLLNTYSKRLRVFVDKIEELTLGKAKERLMNYFYKNSIKENDSLVCNLNITKKQLSELIGLRPETFSRTLKNLIDKGFLKEEKNKLYILKNLKKS